MSTSIQPQDLHDKATRGLPLTSEEQVLLDQWYSQQDQEEHAALANVGSATSLESLRAQVKAATEQLLSVTRRIQAQVSENEAVRQEIVDLRQQLARKSTTLPA